MVSKQYPKLLSNFSLLLQEEMLEVETKNYRFSLGIPCDNNGLESRTPLAVEYSEYGAEIVDNEEVFMSDIILKVAGQSSILNVSEYLSNVHK